MRKLAKGHAALIAAFATCIGRSIGGEPFPTSSSSYPASEPVPQRILAGRSAAEADH